MPSAHLQSSFFRAGRGQQFQSIYLMGGIRFQQAVASAQLEALQPITETESDGSSLRSPSKQQVLVLKQRRRTPPSGSGRKASLLACRLTLQASAARVRARGGPFSHYAVCSGERPCGGIVCPP